MSSSSEDLEEADTKKKSPTGPECKECRCRNYAFETVANLCLRYIFLNVMFVCTAVVQREPASKTVLFLSPIDYK